MLSKSFSTLHTFFKRLNHINNSSAYTSHKLLYPRSTHNHLIFKASFQISNNFNQLKNNFQHYFSPLDQNVDIKSTASNAQNQIKNPQSSQFSIQVIKLAKELQQEQSYFFAPLYHTQTFHYASVLLSLVRLLTQRKVFSDQRILQTYFRQVKNSIKSTQTKLFTPKSALKLIKEFSIIKFDGDESTSLDKILNYVQENSNQFSQIQLQQFKLAYKDIMVNKAFGPVKFRPLNLQKSYSCQTERKAKLVKEKLVKKLKISNTELSVDCNHTKKWFNVKIPSKNLFILTYPNSFSQLSEDTIYQYIYDMKQLVLASRARAALLKDQRPLKIDIRYFQQFQISNDYEIFIEQGIVYKKKIKVIDEMYRLKEMRKLSLKEQIQRINQKKKVLKQKEKNKARQVGISQEQKQILGQTKSMDFILTLKYHLEQLNQDLVEKIKKRNQDKRKLTKKQRKLKDKNLKQNEQAEIQNDEQEDSIDDEKHDQKQDLEQNNEDLSIYKSDPLKLKHQFRQKLSEDLIKYKQVLQQMKQKQAQKKKAHQPLQLTEVLTVKHIQLSIKNTIQRIFTYHTLQQLKEFAAYINFIDSLNSVITQIQTDFLLEKNNNLKKSILMKDKVQNLASKLSSRFQFVKNFLNEPMDTKVWIGQSFDQIFGIGQSNTHHQKGKLNKEELNQLENPQFVKLLIISESQLLNAVEFGEKEKLRKQQVKSKKINPDFKQAKDYQKQQKQKENILEQIFRHKFE